MSHSKPKAWVQGRGNLSLPASPQVVAAYLAHLAEDRGLSVPTIRLHKAVLAAIHKAAGHDDPTDPRESKWRNPVGKHP